jgi:hypothetical protein
VAEDTGVPDTTNWSQWTYANALAAVTGDSLDDLRSKLKGVQWLQFKGDAAGKKVGEGSYYYGYFALGKWVFGVDFNKDAYQGYWDLLYQTWEVYSDLGTGQRGSLDKDSLRHLEDAAVDLQNFLRQAAADYRQRANNLKSGASDFKGKAAAVIQEKLDQYADMLDYWHHQVADNHGMPMRQAVAEARHALDDFIYNMTLIWNSYVDSGKYNIGRHIAEMVKNVHDHMASGGILAGSPNYRLNRRTIVRSKGGPRDISRWQADAYIDEVMRSYPYGDLRSAATWEAMNSEISAAASEWVDELDKYAQKGLPSLSNAYVTLGKAMSPLGNPPPFRPQAGANGLNGSPFDFNMPGFNMPGSNMNSPGFDSLDGLPGGGPNGVPGGMASALAGGLLNGMPLGTGAGALAGLGGEPLGLNGEPLVAGAGPVAGLNGMPLVEGGGPLAGLGGDPLGLNGVPLGLNGVPLTGPNGEALDLNGNPLLGPNNELLGPGGGPLTGPNGELLGPNGELLLGADGKPLMAGGGDQPPISAPPTGRFPTLDSLPEITVPGGGGSSGLPAQPPFTLSDLPPPPKLPPAGAGGGVGTGLALPGGSGGGPGGGPGGPGGGLGSPAVAGLADSSWPAGGVPPAPVAAGPPAEAGGPPVDAAGPGGSPTMPMGGMGGMPYMPGRGGGAGAGDKKERERQTWLSEDEKVWGTDVTASLGVIGRPEDDEEEIDTEELALPLGPVRSRRPAPCRPQAPASAEGPEGEQDETLTRRT